MSRNSRLPAALILNGPPHSGKTWLCNHIISLIPDAVVVRPSDELYIMMQEDGLAPRGMLYQDFKALYPDARERLIAAATKYRSKDVNVFNRRLVGRDHYLNARVLIIDNGGFQDEITWFEEYTSDLILLRVDTAYNELEPMKSRGRRLRAPWAGDSRAPVDHHTMLTAYDSLQMSLLLTWIDTRGRGEAGPYNGIKSLWADRFHFRGEPTGELFTTG